MNSNNSEMNNLNRRPPSPRPPYPGPRPRPPSPGPRPRPPSPRPPPRPYPYPRPGQYPYPYPYPYPYTPRPVPYPIPVPIPNPSPIYSPVNVIYTLPRSSSSGLMISIYGIGFLGGGLNGFPSVLGVGFVSQDRRINLTTLNMTIVSDREIVVNFNNVLRENNLLLSQLLGMNFYVVVRTSNGYYTNPNINSTYLINTA